MNSLVSLQSNFRSSKISNIVNIKYVPFTSTRFTSNTLTISSFTGSNTYQNGTYYVGSSGTYNSNYNPYLVFNDIANGVLTWGWVSPNYSYGSSTGIYAGSVTTSVNGTNILGEYVQIYLPFKFFLKKYQLKNSVGDAGGGMPTIGYLLGSINGSTWVLLDTLNHTDAYWRSNRDLKDYSVDITTSYDYYRLIFNKVGSSNNAFASMMNFNLFGNISA
jgi:hypothetical protein